MSTSALQTLALRVRYLTSPSSWDPSLTPLPLLSLSKILAIYLLFNPAVLCFFPAVFLSYLYRRGNHVPHFLHKTVYQMRNTVPTECAPANDNSHLPPLPSRGRSNTNPFQFDKIRPGHRPLEAVYHTALSSYTRHVSTPSTPTPIINAGSRHRVGNSLPHINITLDDKEKESTHEHHVKIPHLGQNCVNMSSSLTAQQQQPSFPLPLPRPSPRLERAWQDGSIAAAIMASYPTAAAPKSRRSRQ